LRTNDPAIFAVGECAQHRGKVYGLVDPVYEQARVLADVLTGARRDAVYQGSRLSTVLKVMDVDVTSMGDINGEPSDSEVISHVNPRAGVYKKLVIRNGRLAGAVLVGAQDHGNRLRRMFTSEEPLPGPALDLLLDGTARDALLEEGAGADLTALADDTQICNCHTVSKGRIVAAIREGKGSLQAIGECTRACTGCGTCQPLLAQLIDAYADPARKGAAEKNKIEIIKEEKNGLDCLPDIYRFAARNNWEEMTEA